MTTNNQTCKNCEKTGLPILPVRYSVLPNKVKATLPAGIGGARVTDVALDAHHYGLRTLREGWIYLFYEVGARGSRYWEVYKVTSDGRLWKQSLPLPRELVIHPSCARGAMTVPMDIIAIERPEKCTGRVFIAFSAHAWHKDVLDRYASDAALMQARMQFIKPSEWVASGADANGHAIVATEKVVDSIVEYMPGFDPRLLALPDEKQSFSDQKGGYNEGLLKHEVSRYHPFIRQASPASASRALVKLMNQIGATGADPGGDASHCPPMMLALWDGIGIVHELNGFRGDPVSWLDLYVTKERALQVGALQSIDAAYAIVQSRTNHEVKGRETTARNAHSTTALAQPMAQGALDAQRARTLAGAAPHRVAQVNAYYDDMNWMAANKIPGTCQNKLIRLSQSTSAGNANSSVPYTGTYRDETLNDARNYLKVQPGAHDRNVAKTFDYNWSKYEVLLKRQEIERFRAQYKALQSAVFDLQESRSADVGKWLQAKLFLDTLEDYQSPDMLDAAAFEITITDAIAGLGSTPKGKQILDALVTQWDPLQPGSIIWRVFAMNQKDARQELGKLLKAALAKKNMPLESAQAGTSNSPGVEAVFSAAAMIGKLSGYYGKLSALALETDPKKISPIGALLKRLGVDTFGMTVGDAIFKQFRINQIGDFVGEKIIQSVFLQRSGISYVDAMKLVRQQAKLEMLSRRETVERLVRTRSILRADAPTQVPRSTLALYDVWDEMQSTDDGVKALRSSRIAVVAALMEAVNFYKIMTAATDEDTELKLIQSGASLLSSLITITMTPFYVALKDSVRSQSWKLVGGGLSSFGTFISTWIAGEKTIKLWNEGKMDLMGIYALKSVAGFCSGGAILVEATSTAAPLLRKIANRYGTIIVIEAVETVTKRAIALAAIRYFTWLTGWEAMIFLIVIEAMAAWLTPTELEEWCSRCVFSAGKAPGIIVINSNVTLYSDPSKQEKDFFNAMTSLL